ncbi:MAG TPA: hypothetical protein VMW06_11700 [Desulfobacterales bacterium]|nr:hypothetical protein [Desulfobacterales bacterium]
MKKKKEPYPTVIKRTSKLPTKAELKRMDEKIKAPSQKHIDYEKLLKEDKPMTKKDEKASEKKARAPKKSLTPEDISRMIAEWDDKTTVEWTYEFGVSYQTVLKMAEVIRKEDKTLCPKKKPKPRTREDVAKAGIALFRKKKGKK